MEFVTAGNCYIVLSMLLGWFIQAYLYLVFLYGLIDQLLWICRSIAYESCSRLRLIFIIHCWFFIIIFIAIIIKQELLPSHNSITNSEPLIYVF